MWSLGCILAHLFLGESLYPATCEYEAVRIIVQINGQPNDEFLDAARKTDSFFHETSDPQQKWWLKSTQEFEGEIGFEIESCGNF